MLSKNYREAFEGLTDEDAGKLIKACFAHEYGEEVKLEGAVKGIWPFVRAGLDDNRAEIKEAEETGKKGGRPKKETATGKRETQYSEGFNRFWESYPNKKDKGAAWLRYQARIRDGYSPEELERAAKAYADECDRDQRPKQFIKHGSTFLGVTGAFSEYLQGDTDAPAGTDSGYVEIDLSNL